MKGEKIYGIADKAWQVVVGCDPHMPCAPRCWARKTVARVVKCQEPKHPERAEFFQVALTPDGSKWSGEVRLDEAHLTDPLKWGKPALIATGFHGDWGRLPDEAIDRVFEVIAKCGHLQFLPLTKAPCRIVDYCVNFMSRVLGEDCGCWDKTPSESRVCHVECGCQCHEDYEPLPNVNIGCSVMNQSEADKYREPMRAIAALGWNTHAAIGAVSWSGWEFLRGMISGGESGANSRPSDPAWHRETRDWCIANGIPYNFKQWGDWCDWDNLPDAIYHELDAAGLPPTESVVCVGKKRAGRLLDGRTWDGLPAFR